MITYVDTMDGLEAAAERAAGCDVVAIDTESNSMHCYRESVCFIQIECADDIFLIDTVALRDMRPLAAALADPMLETVLHGADYDVVCLRRDFDLEIASLADTMIAAQFLGKPGLGLAALSKEYFGVEMDKTLTRHDWGRRPLEEHYIKYLADDVEYLRRLWERLAEEVVEAGIEEEVSLEFERVSRMQWSERVFDPYSYIKIKGSRDLETRDRAMLMALLSARNEVAEKEDLPPFKVASNQALLAMAQRGALRRGDPSGLRGFRSRLVDRYRDDIMAHVARAAAGEIDPTPPRNNDGKRVKRSEQACHDTLRKWRRGVADERGCPTVVVLPNHALQRILTAMPSDLDALETTPGLGRSRTERYGRDILTILDKFR